VQRRQQLRWAEQDQRAAAALPTSPGPAPAAADDAISVQLAQLKQLGELRDAGILTDAEFEAKKTVILGG
jgi:hypothetical protein